MELNTVAVSTIKSGEAGIRRQALSSTLSSDRRERVRPSGLLGAVSLSFDFAQESELVELPNRRTSPREPVY